MFVSVTISTEALQKILKRYVYIVCITKDSSMLGAEPNLSNRGKMVSVVFPQEAYGILKKIADEELSTVPDVVRRVVAPTIAKYKKQEA